MKYAPVMPPLTIEQLEPRWIKAVFCYADVALESTAYRKWFEQLDRTKIDVVLDAPIVEKGKVPDPTDMAQLARWLNPTFMFIPDVQFDYRATLSRFNHYAARIDHQSATGVIQGKYLSEQMVCANEMYAAGIRRLALPRPGPKNGGTSRYHLISALNPTLPDVKWHLLGARWPYQDERACSTIPNVISIDTAEPVNAALRYGRILTERSIPEDVKRPEQFLSIKHVRHVEALRVNIQRFQEWLK